MNALIKSTLVAGFALVGTFVSQNAQAADVAWLLADNPTAASYTPSATNSYSSKGGTISVRRGGTGAYSVKLGSLNGSQNNAIAAHVVAYGGSHRCHTTGWAGDATSQTINVFCYNGAQPVDARFALVYYDESTKSQLAGAHMYGVRTWNSMGGTNTKKKLGTGSYEVKFERLGSVQTNNVLVTSMSTISQYCKVQSFTKVKNGAWQDLVLKVLCFNANGTAADAAFVASVLANPYFGATATRRHGAYALATQPGAAKSYATDPTFTFNSTTASPNTTGVTSKRTAAGTYSTSLSGLPVSNSTIALAVAYGADNGYCSPISSTGSTTATTLKVECRSGTGALKDSKFGVLYLTNKAIPGSAWAPATLY